MQRDLRSATPSDSRGDAFSNLEENVVPDIQGSNLWCRRVLAAAAAVALTALSSTLQAQGAWPNKPIRFIIPAGVGGAADFTGRTFGRFVEAQLKQPVVVENKPGAASIIGSEALKVSAPDGYTYMIGGSSTTAANPVLFTKLSYDPAKDFDEVGLFGYFPIIGMVKKDSPIRSVADIIRMARENPGKVTYAHQSALAQISPELIKAQAKVNLLAVSYKNVGQVGTDIAGGVVDFTFLDAISATPMLQSGLLRAIAVTSPQRVTSMPDVQTVAETLPGFEVQGWQGLHAPKGLAAPILARMNTLIQGLQGDAAGREALERQGMIVKPTPGPVEHTRFVIADRVRWAEWVRIANIKPE